LVLFLASSACIAERGPLTNRMAHSATNYLSRAARQPVNWQPWGREAFALAAKLDRPVLLYIGGETCRWCSETDRAIYTDPEIGALINGLFVPIRVDRDERPDVAQRYQVAVEVLAGLRGWPLTVFLTSDGAPFFGGTYFPPDDPVTGRGLKQILPEVAQSYRDQRSFIVQHAALVRQLMLTGPGGGGGSGAHGVLQLGQLRRHIANLRAQVAEGAVAVGVASIEAASLLLTEYARDNDSLSLLVARRVLSRILDSTILASSDDPPRLVRAALLGALAKAWVVTGIPRYRDAGTSLARGLLHELRDPDDHPLFADQEAFLIGSLISSAATFGESHTERRATAALDELLQRVYARGWGVRHSAIGSGRRGGSGTQGLLQDQVQVAIACLAAHQVTQEQRYLAVARDLAAILDSAYADPSGGYFDDAATPAPPAASDPAAPALADRTKSVFDDMLPGANATAARMLLWLADATGEVAYRRRAEATLEAFAGRMGAAHVRVATFLSAAREALTKTYSPH
jgi:uncharacterized protein YyaL (SSP411 family)